MKLALKITAGIVVGGLLLLTIHKHFRDPLDPPPRVMKTTPAQSQ